MRHLALLLSFFCIACVSHEEYPSDWPPVAVSTTECPNIAGTYENLGTVASDIDQANDIDILLSDILSRESVDSNAHLTIVHPDAGSIQATVVGPDETHDPQIFSIDDGDYSCEAGKIWFTSFGLWDMDVVLAIGYDKAQIGFAKTEDGSLIGEVRSSGAGVVLMIVPIAGSASDYILWKTIQSKSER